MPAFYLIIYSKVWSMCVGSDLFDFFCSLSYVCTNTIYWRSTRILSKQNKCEWISVLKWLKKWIKIAKKKSMPTRVRKAKEMKKRNIIWWEETEYFHRRARTVDIVYEQTDPNMGKWWIFFIHRMSSTDPTI